MGQNAVCVLVRVNFGGGAKGKLFSGITRKFE